MVCYPLILFLFFVITTRLSIINLLLFTARVVTDRVSGYSKGFGFVKYATLDDAAKGIKGMDGQVS
jgi:RNA recognition motif-containing protein